MHLYPDMCLLGSFVKLIGMGNIDNGLLKVIIGKFLDE